MEWDAEIHVNTFDQLPHGAGWEPVGWVGGGSSLLMTMIYTPSIISHHHILLKTYIVEGKVRIKNQQKQSKFYIGAVTKPLFSFNFY